MALRQICDSLSARQKLVANHFEALVSIRPKFQKPIREQTSIAMDHYRAS